MNETTRQLKDLIEHLVNKEIISNKSFVAFVDDGSKDATWKIIEEKAHQNKYIKGLKLAGNVGHQKALLAGLLTFNDDVDALISIDADLQDDISIIEEMIEKYKSGADIVYGVRKARVSDTFFKRNTTLFFYFLMKKMKTNVIDNHADYRLCSNRVIKALSDFNEVNLFLRGIIPLWVSTKKLYITIDWNALLVNPNIHCGKCFHSPGTVLPHSVIIHLNW